MTAGEIKLLLLVLIQSKTETLSIVAYFVIRYIEIGQYANVRFHI